MEVTTKEMITVKNRLINLMTTIYFINHQERERERELVNILKKYPRESVHLTLPPHIFLSK